LSTNYWSSRGVSALNGIFPAHIDLFIPLAAMEAHNRDAALAIHVDLLTKGSQTDDIGLWMSGLKQLIMRM
jgi:protein transport protein SEC31